MTITTIADLPTVRGSSRTLKLFGNSFAQWWLSGLREAIPSRMRKWAGGGTKQIATLWRVGDTVVCGLSAAGRSTIKIPYSDFNTAALERWFTEQGVSRAATTLTLIVSRDHFLVRELSVPKAALGALPRILDQDILRRTPFELADIWHAANVVGVSGDDIVSVHHWIIRRDRAEAALAEIGLTSRDVDCLAVADAGGDAISVINFQVASNEEPTWALRAIQLLAIAALSALALALFALEWRQANLAAAVETALMEAKQTAQNGRDGMEPLARLFVMKGETGILGIWDELSRILPDHTFLTEIGITDESITLQGFSADAPRMVRIIDESALFSGATLISAIRPDANENKDRFSLAFKLRSARATQSAVKPLVAR